MLDVIVLIPDHCHFIFSGSNTDGSFTTAISNSFLSPLKNHITADLG